MKPSPSRTVLHLLRQVSGSEIVDRMGLQEPAERIAFHASRAGSRVASRASKGLKKAGRLLLPGRFPPGDDGGQRFDLRLSEEQTLLRHSLRSVAAERIRPLAPAADAARCLPQALEDELKTLGLADLFVPSDPAADEEPRSVVTSFLATEDLAWGDAGITLAALASAAARNALLRWGSPAQQARLLGQDGSQLPVASLAVNEPVALFDANTLRSSARLKGRHYLLSGEKCLVPNAARCEWFVVAAALERGENALFIVPRDAAGLLVEADPAMGLGAAGFGQLLLENVELEQDALLASGDFSYRQFLQLGSLASGALCTGTARAVLDYVIGYCKQREAFGEPLAQRQAVAFQIADMATELEALRLLLLRAAAQADQGMDAARAIRLAVIALAEQGPKIGAAGVQLLGGHGYVREHPVERWYRHLCTLATLQTSLLL